MDTVREETSSAVSTPSAATSTEQFLYPNIANHTNDDDDAPKISRSTSISSRRPSLILAALRRPSQALALSAAHAIMKQKKQIMGYLSSNPDRNGAIVPDNDKREPHETNDKHIKNDNLATILSALYAKILVVLGIAFPVTEIISKDVRPFFYQGFYLYLYMGSIAFVAYMYTSLVRNKAIYSIFGSYDGNKSVNSADDRNKAEYLQGQNHEEPIVRYGSFYLRLGAIAFGIGSMVYSGLEFGRYFELRNDNNCYSSVLQAITPATRMILTIIQIQFIFLNSKDIGTTHNKIVAKFGFMHMIATNLCEWLYVLVEETEHEIIHLAQHHHTSQNVSEHFHCQTENVMTSLVANASPFLFPCTIEYSLICAVILLEMWKEVKTVHENQPEEKKEVKETRVVFVSHQEKVTNVYNFQSLTTPAHGSAHHFTVDCSNSHKGLFAGILVIVLTIISLTIFFVLRAEKGTPEEELIYKAKAQLEVNIFETTLHIISTLAIIMVMYKFKNLKYERKLTDKSSGLGLDNTLLVVAQTGMFIYCVFSIIGSYFTTPYHNPAGLLAEVFSFIQTCLQTLFVLDSWTKRCNPEQVKRKPGRELITFLIIANMALWSINCLEKNRAEFRTNHLNFYGPWAWTIITHISMPLAVFYRFHSTICLFEIWKSAYKVKSQYKNQFSLNGYL
ncbi:hypothetical protein Trydic_g20849 [Trypoxylus dichotomus]